ncbi:MAG: glycine cleavage system protein GcvH [Candidatus Omnitrophota bacterium]|nr:glycine cleavage system protein GcvH [Candidatus Omnitrophota bacterium]MDZ4242375.1 glycine cleavage system protein GcvH [Candidatus Omnitrophota bacterium]
MNHYFYTKEHEWVNIDDAVATVGITEYAQEALGDITFVELPAPDIEVEQFEHLASVESVKAASDIFSPVSGKVVEANHDLEANPGLINKDCYEKGWIAKIEVSDPEEKSNLMTAAEYRSFLKTLE